MWLLVRACGRNFFPFFSFSFSFWFRGEGYSYGEEVRVSPRLLCNCILLFGKPKFHHVRELCRYFAECPECSCGCVAEYIGVRPKKFRKKMSEVLQSPDVLRTVSEICGAVAGEKRNVANAPSTGLYSGRCFYGLLKQVSAFSACVVWLCSISVTEYWRIIYGGKLS